MHLTERELLDQAKKRLATLLPSYIELTEPSFEHYQAGEGADAIWELRALNSGYGQILVHGKLSLQPRDVERLDGSLTKAVRQMLQHPTVLLVAPWLSPRSRTVIEERGFSYLDLTGNVFLRHERPAIYLRLQGADRDPNPRERPPARLQGPKARRLVRLLVDHGQPNRLTELADAGQLNPGYVSRLLDALDDQALIERGRRGLVENVHWPDLLVAAAENYSLTRNNGTKTFVAPGGAGSLYRKLAEPGAPAAVVTGSFAAAAVHPIAAPTQLVFYSDEVERLRHFGRLLPADRGADVMVLRPEDPSQLERDRVVEGTRHVGLSQLVMDCLGGPGRLPQEGEAVLDWMRRHEEAWRRPALEKARSQNVRSS